MVAHQGTPTHIEVTRLRGAKVAQVGLEMGDDLQGLASAFVPSSPGLFSHDDSAQVSLGVPRGVPAAGGVGAAEELSRAKPPSCVWL